MCDSNNNKKTLIQGRKQTQYEKIQKQQITGSTLAKHLGDIAKSATRRYGYKHTDTTVSVVGWILLIKRAVKTL